VSTGIIWARVSSAEQALHGYSLNAQVKALADAAANFKLRPIKIIREFKIQESGSRSERRRHFKTMVNFVSENKADYIVVFKVDRLARNYKDFFAVQDLIESGVSIFIVNENKVYSRSSSPSDRFLFRMLGNVAQLEAEMIGERTLLGMTAKFSAGGIPFMCPIGYLPAPDPSDSTGKRRTILVDPVRAPLVKELFQLYAEGDKALSEVTEIMSRKGLTSRPALTWPERGRGPRPLTQTSIHKILRNAFYYGETRWSGKVITGSHEPLIPKALYNQVQFLLNKHCTYRRPDSKKLFVFRGMAVCGKCWKPLKADTQSGAHKSGTYIYYSCRREGCSNRKNFPESQIARLVEEEMTNLSIPPAFAKKVKANLNIESAEQTAADRAALTRLNKKETALKDRASLLYDDRLAGHISLELYKTKAQEIDTALAEVRQEKEQLESPNVSFHSDGNMLISLLHNVRGRYVKAAPETRRRILSIMLDKAVLRPGDEYLTWKEPFATLQDMIRVNSNRVSSKVEVG
jgi:DNA invertase Pin-like site-specific DNA recombinase